jgi:hypothetical protein
MGEFIAEPGFSERTNHKRPRPAGIAGACSELAAKHVSAMPAIAITQPPKNTPIAARGSALIALTSFMTGSPSMCQLLVPKLALERSESNL